MFHAKKIMSKKNRESNCEKTCILAIVNELRIETGLFEKFNVSEKFILKRVCKFLHINMLLKLFSELHSQIKAITPFFIIESVYSHELHHAIFNVHKNPKVNLKNLLKLHK
jgi:hypothetical protein